MEPTNNTKEIFSRCGTCSQTFAYLLNDQYGHHNTLYEKAIDTLAGGIFREGQQCGMLWGAIMATGAEAFHRTDNIREAEAMTLSAAKELVKSFSDKAHTIQCREITGVNMKRFAGLLQFTVKTMLAGIKNSQCFELAEAWTPAAVDTSAAGLDTSHLEYTPTHNCAAIMARRLDATQEEAVMVAGFAGGLGLSGKGCGALAVVIWKITLDWLRNHPKADAPPMFNFPEVSHIIKAYKDYNGGKIQCESICKRKFRSAVDHSEFMENGGCQLQIAYLQKEYNNLTA